MIPIHHTLSNVIINRILNPSNNFGWRFSAADDEFLSQMRVSLEFESWHTSILLFTRNRISWTVSDGTRLPTGRKFKRCDRARFSDSFGLVSLKRCGLQHEIIQACMYLKNWHKNNLGHGCRNIHFRILIR